jgi:hypothetical protein
MSERRPGEAPPEHDDLRVEEPGEDGAHVSEDDVHGHAFSFTKVVKDAEESADA